MSTSYADFLSKSLQFVQDEQQAGEQNLHEVWGRPLAEKLTKGLSQQLLRLEATDEATAAWAYLGDNESRFREGDLLLLHGGTPQDSLLGRRVSLELDEGHRWLLRDRQMSALLKECSGGPLFADPDAMDMTPYYRQALNEISTTQIGREIVLPLLTNNLDITSDDDDFSEAERTARHEGFNDTQAEAVGHAFGAQQLACIQGPPGTGKTKVLSLIVRLMVQRGERVLVTSHTHMAINNALNKIHAQGVPTIKVGLVTQRKGLDDDIVCVPDLGAWEERPTNGYVVGATPFATCSARLGSWEFDTVVFDEASQITVPLALMAMRKGKRYIFIGDQAQLPPVMLSRSVLDAASGSVFSTLINRKSVHTVMLSETYRMNRWLTAWPSHQYYDDKLVAVGPNQNRRLEVLVPGRFAPIFEPSASAVFIPTLDKSARAQNLRDAELVTDLCQAAIGAGLPPEHIGIVTPYRAQGRAIRNLLIKRLGFSRARPIIADTVERMQGQERELILLSLATGDEAFLGAVASFFFQPERLNVSITRPTVKLIMVGPELNDAPTLEDKTLRGWILQYQDLVSHMKRVALS